MFSHRTLTVGERITVQLVFSSTRMGLTTNENMFLCLNVGSDAVESNLVPKTGDQLYSDTFHNVECSLVERDLFKTVSFSFFISRINSRHSRFIRETISFVCPDVIWDDEMSSVDKMSQTLGFDEAWWGWLALSGRLNRKASAVMARHVLFRKSFFVNSLNDEYWPNRHFFSGLFIKHRPFPASLYFRLLDS